MGTSDDSKGDILELPKGASPVDFAYHIHTDIGNQIAGVKINNTISKIDTQLKAVTVLKF